MSGRTVRRSAPRCGGRGAGPGGRFIPAAGFTLLELMIALSLLAMMLAMAYSAFATATQAIPRGEDAAALSGRLRMATALITRQVRSLVDYSAETDEQVHPFFEGGPDSFSFITSSPQLAGGGDGLGWVTYASDGKSLRMAERLIFSRGNLTGGTGDPEAQAELLSGLEGVRFQYLRLDGVDNEWLSEWNALEEQALPGAIKIELMGIGQSRSYWVQEIPVMTVVYGLGSYDSDAIFREGFGTFGTEGRGGGFDG